MHTTCGGDDGRVHTGQIARPHTQALVVLGSCQINRSVAESRIWKPCRERPPHIQDTEHRARYSNLIHIQLSTLSAGFCSCTTIAGLSLGCWKAAHWDYNSVACFLC